jgi:hypothetical protein
MWRERSGSETMVQTLVTAVIVVGSAAYASWRLMPDAWRRALARRVGRDAPAGGCGGCDGCEPARANHAAAKPIRVHRRRG